MQTSNPLIPKFREHIRVRGAGSTAHSYALWANRLEDWASRKRTTLQSPRILREWAHDLAYEGKSPSSVRVAVAGGQSYLRWLSDQGYRIAIQEAVEFPRARVAVPFTPSPTELGRFLASAAALLEPYATLIHTLPYTGMRVSEACSLRESDGRLSSDGWIVLRVRESKNGQARDVPVLPEASDGLRGYVQERRPALLQGAESDWLFPWPGYPDRCVTRREVARAFESIRLGLGLLGLTPHACRRYYVNHLARAGVDKFAIMRMIGHSGYANFLYYYFPTVDDMVSDLRKAGFEEGGLDGLD